MTQKDIDEAMRGAAKDAFLDIYGQRYEEYFRLSLAASYASLFFLLQAEQTFPLLTRSHPHLLNISWLSACLSVLAGTSYLTHRMLRPAQQGESVEAIPVSDAHQVDASKGSRGILVWKVFETKLSKWAYWTHLGSLIGVAVSFALFKWFN